MSKLNMFAQNSKKFIHSSLFPEKFSCLMCDVEIFEGELCGDCLKELVFNDGETCPKCGRKTAKSEICIECKAHAPVYDRAFSPLVYEGGSLELVSLFKERHPFIAKYLAGLIVTRIKEFPQADGIVCVPTSDMALRKRGYNQSELLAVAVANATGIPFFPKAVEKIKDTPAQKGLGREQRIKNLQHCFKADEEQVKGKTLILIDDILTTGATAECITKTLKTAGACAVFVITATSVKYKN